MKNSDTLKAVLCELDRHGIAYKVHNGGTHWRVEWRNRRKSAHVATALCAASCQALRASSLQMSGASIADPEKTAAPSTIIAPRGAKTTSADGWWVVSYLTTGIPAAPR